MDKESWHIHTRKYYPAIKRNKLLIRKTIWMNPKAMIPFIKHSWDDTLFKKEIYNYFTYLFGCTQSELSEKAMAPHSSTLAWKIPWTEEAGRLQSMGSLGVGHD